MGLVGLAYLIQPTLDPTAFNPPPRNFLFQRIVEAAGKVKCRKMAILISLE